VHAFYKMFLNDVYSQTRHVFDKLGTILRGGTEHKNTRHFNIRGQTHDLCT
jgi:hypothetical protein